MNANEWIRRSLAATLCVVLALATAACDDSGGAAQRDKADGMASADKPLVRGADLGAAPADDADDAKNEQALAADAADDTAQEPAPAPQPAPPADAAVEQRPQQDAAAPAADASPEAEPAAPSTVDAPAPEPAPAPQPPAETTVEVDAQDAPKVAAPATDGDAGAPKPAADSDDVQVAIATPQKTDPAADAAAKPKRQIKPGPPAGQGIPADAQPTVGDGQEHPSFQQLAAVSPPLPDVPKVEGYQSVSFDKLSEFPYYVDVPEGFDEGLGPGSADPATAPGATDPNAPDATELAKKGDDQIPAEVKALNEEKIAIVGYMVPIDFEQGKTNEFVLIRVIPSCFFCQQPMINEWIEVKTKDGKRFPYNGDEPLLVTGVLSVGAEKKDGFVTSVYRLEADNVEVVEIK